VRRLGPYELREALARGGVGTVYRGWDPALEREVAVKVLTELGGSQLLARFEREAAVHARLRHPHVVAVHAAGHDRGVPYLVMDLVPGESLQRRLDRAGPLPVAEAVAAVRKLARAVAAAHDLGVLHRDLKPANVLLAPGDGGALEPRLTDFGLAAIAAASGERLTATGAALGTPGYWPPEQARGELARIGPASDVYGLGATLYALLTGRPPVAGETPAEALAALADGPPEPPSARRPEVDAGLEAIVLRCLAADPAARYPTATALAEALEAWAGGGAAPPRVARRAVAAGSIALAVAAAALLGVTAAAWPEPAASPASSASPEEPPPERPPDATEPAAPDDAAPVGLVYAPGDVTHSWLERRETLGRGDPGLVRLDLVERTLAAAPERVDIAIVVSSLRVEGFEFVAFDSAAPGSGGSTLIADAFAPLLGEELRLALDPRTGRLLDVGGLPEAAPPAIDFPGSAEITQQVRYAAGLLSGESLSRFFGGLTHVLPGDDRRRWAIEETVWHDHLVGFEGARAFRRDGARVTGRFAGGARPVAAAGRRLSPGVRFSEPTARHEARVEAGRLLESTLELAFTRTGPRPGRVRVTFRYAVTGP